MSTLPLLNKRIVVTRAQEQAAGLIEELSRLGADVVHCPAIAFAPPADPRALDAALQQLDRYDWLIVTSVNGVRAVFERMDTLGIDAAALGQLKIGAIGPATAQALAARGLQADFVPSAFVAEAILAEIPSVAGKRVLLPRADIARETLAVGLRVQGAIVDELTAYRTVPGSGAATLAPLLRDGLVDAISFTSSSTVRYLLDGLEQQHIPRQQARHLFQRVAIICIGPITSSTARDEGLTIAAEAREYTAEGVIQALLELFAGNAAG